MNVIVIQYKKDESHAGRFPALQSPVSFFSSFWCDVVACRACCQCVAISYYVDLNISVKMDGSDFIVSDVNSENRYCESINKTVCAGTKKRKRCGRANDVMKKLRLCTHKTGQRCKCKRLKCFEVLSQNNIKKIIKNFNELSSYNEQSLYLPGLISVYQIKNLSQGKMKMMLI